MIAHDQLNCTERQGDCWVTCLECVLEWPVGRLPRPTLADFATLVMWQDYMHVVKSTLESCGWWCLVVQGLVDALPWAPMGWAVGGFVKPKRHGGNVLHALVCHDGRIVHDPHPGFRVNVSPEEWGEAVAWTMLVPLDPAQWRVAKVGTYIAPHESSFSLSNCSCAWHGTGPYAFGGLICGTA